VKERPILFSAPMVRALLAGRKSMTRRTVKPQPGPHLGLQEMWGTSPDGFAFGEPGLWRVVGEDYPDDESDDRRCPYGAPGDRLCVREAFRYTDEFRQHVEFRADQDKETDGFRWRPSIHLPWMFSRLMLEITRVRVEQLQEITEEDARAEGVTLMESISPDQRLAGTGERFGDAPHRCAFACLWDEINPETSWVSNPWVWVVKFRRVVTEGAKP